MARPKNPTSQVWHWKNLLIKMINQVQQFDQYWMWVMAEVRVHVFAACVCSVSVLSKKWSPALQPSLILLWMNWPPCSNLSTFLSFPQRPLRQSFITVCYVVTSQTCTKVQTCSWKCDVQRVCVWECARKLLWTFSRSLPASLAANLWCLSETMWGKSSDNSQLTGGRVSWQ